MALKILDSIEGPITTLSTDARGVLEKDGKSIQIPFALPGDIVRTTLVKRQKGVLEGRLDEVLTASPDRIEAPCPHASTCGGCPLQALGYEGQKKWKRQFIVDAFREAAIPTTVPEVTGAASLFWHRNRMDYVISAGDEGARIGLKERGRWWSPFDMKTCLMLSEDANEVVNRVRAWLREEGIPGWDPRTHVGEARYLVIREGKNTNERMAILVTKSETIPHLDALAKKLEGLTTSFYHAVNSTITDLSVGQTYTLVSGKATLTEIVRGKRFEILPTAFFQTNTAGAAMLAETVEALAAFKKSDVLLDLYCGAGFFSVQFADQVARVLGVEIDAQAIEAANQNAKENSVTNATFRLEKAEALSWKDERADVAIVDPPRAGLHPDVLKTLLTCLPNRIVYVSCNYASLAKELPRLLTAYDLTETRVIDLFPHTPHIETIVLLTKKS